MVTTVGNETTFKGLVENLLLLEHDAIAAYDETIARLDNPDWKRQVSEFRGDHDRHVQELKQLASQAGANVPEQGDMKQMLTTGKIKLATMMGDRTILAAMRTNEEDTVTAYQRAATHQEAPMEARRVFERAHSDELRHREWMINNSHA
jgi:rubrerythrin